MKKYFIVLLVLSLIFFPNERVSAASPSQTLRISPVILPVDLTPGNISTQSMTIENLTDSPLPVKATVEGFESMDEEGGYIFGGNSVPPLVSWTTLDLSDMILEPHKPKTVTATIRVPSTVPFGGYYAVLFFTPMVKDSKNQTVVPKVGALMLANIGTSPDYSKPESILQLLEWQLPLFSEKFPLLTSFRVKNTALHYVSVKPIVTMINLNRNPIQQMLPEKILLPGKIRKWDSQITSEGNNYGIYTVTLLLSLGKGKYITSVKHIIVVPYKETLIMTGILLILFIIIKKRKNLTHAVRVLVRG